MAARHRTFEHPSAFAQSMVADRTTALPDQLPDGSPSARRLLAAHTSVMQLKHTLTDRLPAARRAAYRALAERQATQ